MWAPQAVKAYENCRRGFNSDFRPLVILNRTTWSVCTCMQKAVGGGQLMVPMPTLAYGM